MASPHTEPCPIAQLLNLIGDKWTLLLIREAMYGTTRFKDYQANTGIARNLLAERLNRLVEAGILRATPISSRGASIAYELTEKGASMKLVLIAMVQWSNQHLFDKDAQPLEFIDKKHRKPIGELRITNHLGKRVDANEVIVRAGPGASKAMVRRLQAASQVNAR